MMNRMWGWIKREWLKPAGIAALFSICYVAYDWHASGEARDSARRREELAETYRSEARIDSTVRVSVREEVPSAFDSLIAPVRHSSDSALVLIGKVEYGQEIILRLIGGEKVSRDDRSSSEDRSFGNELNTTTNDHEPDSTNYRAHIHPLEVHAVGAFGSGRRSTR